MSRIWKTFNIEILQAIAAVAAAFAGEPAALAQAASAAPSGTTGTPLLTGAAPAVTGAAPLVSGATPLASGATSLATGAAPLAQPTIAPLPPIARATPIGSGAGGSIQLSVNDQRLIPTKRLRRVAVGDPNVADVMPVADGVMVIAKKPGMTTVSIWDGKGRSPLLVPIQVQPAGAAALLYGTGAAVHTYGDTTVLEGTTASLPEHQAALAAAQQAAGQSGKVVDRSMVGVGGVVQVDVKIVEFSRTALKEAGFNLFSTRSNGFGFGVFGPSNLTSYSPSSGGVSFGSTVGTAMSTAFNLVAGPFGNGLFANLSVLEANGLARVLAEPSLVALSGQSASFLAGGELPIPESGGLGTVTVTFKSFGIGLTVTPTVLAPDRIGLKVAPEASELDYTHEVTVAGTSIPAVTTRRADTTVELGDGQSFVIGGLVSRTTIASVNKVPMLGDLPILGAFFKNLNYSQDDKELVIVVTPHLVQPIARGATVPLPADGRDANTQPVWGSFLRGPSSGSDLPGFSR